MDKAEDPTGPPEARATKNMDRWLGNGGMEIIGALGASFDSYGTSPETPTGPGVLGWVKGSWKPEALACNPHGIVQAGVHSVVLDAAMNFAINSALAGRDRTRATLEMKTETLRVVQAGDDLAIEGFVVRLAKQVAYAEATVSDSQGRMASRSTGTFLLHRE